MPEFPASKALLPSDLLLWTLIDIVTIGSTLKAKSIVELILEKLLLRFGRG